jgi:3-isopropylmalate/(R)-2-methylmalate dehydratase small subunit
MKPFNVLTAVAAPLSAKELGAEPVWTLHGSAYRHAKILVTGTRLGCDADHAAPRLADHGIRCIISSAIEDMFFSSCVSSGILPIALSEPEVQTLLADTENPESALMTIDLPQQEIVRAGGLVVRFRLDRSVKERLMHGVVS